jgi:oligoendopeptidase F
MKKLSLAILLSIIVLIPFAQEAAIGGVSDVFRDQIPDKDKWDLTDLYENDASWNSKKSELEGMIEVCGTFKGKLGDSADILFQCLDYSSMVLKEYRRLSSYASKRSDQDTRETGPLAMTQEIRQVGVKLRGATSFVEPEILSIDADKVQEFFRIKPELKEYKHYIDNIRRMKPHTLSTQEEKLIADAGLMSWTAYDVYNIFKHADMPRPTMTMDDGDEVRLDDASYTLYRADADRKVRMTAFEDFWGAYKSYERSYGAQLYGQIKRDIFYKNVRKYDSCLESALDANNIPTSVYTSLLSSVNEHLPTLHRYLKLRKRMLGLDELHYYDMYPSLVKDVELTYSVEEAQELIEAALKPLGEEYVALVDEAFTDRWIDMRPNTGKRAGAYSSGSAYDVHPYILMNYNGMYNDVSTLAHELGHALHSYYSNENQTFPNAYYPIFLAEVASITNEHLLVDHVLKQIADPNARLSILGNQLETFRVTLFRQTQFAEFELRIHEMAEEGKALTGETLSQVYLEILKKYYGHDQGVTVIEDLYGIEWVYIQHFFYNFYVFQYATSFCAATAVAERILAEGPRMRDTYIDRFLSAGGSDYAIPILKSIGIDMTTSEPFDMAIREMNRIMDEIEEILDK